VVVNMFENEIVQFSLSKVKLSTLKLLYKGFANEYDEHTRFLTEQQKDSDDYVHQLRVQMCNICGEADERYNFQFD